LRVEHSPARRERKDKREREKEKERSREREKESSREREERREEKSREREAGRSRERSREREAGRSRERSREREREKERSRERENEERRADKTRSKHKKKGSQVKADDSTEAAHEASTTKPRSDSTAAVPVAPSPQCPRPMSWAGDSEQVSRSLTPSLSQLSMASAENDSDGDWDDLSAHAHKAQASARAEEKPPEEQQQEQEERKASPLMEVAIVGHPLHDDAERKDTMDVAILGGGVEGGRDEASGASSGDEAVPPPEKLHKKRDKKRKKKRKEKRERSESVVELVRLRLCWRRNGVACVLTLLRVERDRARADKLGARVHAADESGPAGPGDAQSHPPGHHPVPGPRARRPRSSPLHEPRYLIRARALSLSLFLFFVVSLSADRCLVREEAYRENVVKEILKTECVYNAKLKCLIDVSNIIICFFAIRWSFV
jgi:hypothetical protein